jgi:chromate transport protein ChrA
MYSRLSINLDTSLPVAAIMFGLAVGVGQIQQQLPDPVYALLSGLNASTVGIIALAAVQLAERAIIDQLSRILIIFVACAGLCYTSLWYFPVLMLVGGLIASVWDTWLNIIVVNAWNKVKKRKTNNEALVEENVARAVEVSNETRQPSNASQVSKDEDQNEQPLVSNTEQEIQEVDPVKTEEPSQEKASDVTPTSKVVATEPTNHSISIKVGILIIVMFFLSFIALMVARGLLRNPPHALSLFANMYLAGTIIFGGGPVVIPLLREYVVQPGWVTPRDFLIGLAIIQAAPGPNFNFAVYLGALALRGTPSPMILGAFLGWAGIFVPGMTLAVGVQALWRVLRSRPSIVAALRGINASAIGLVFTAVYRLWEIGYLTKQATAGQSLAMNPWWLVVTALAYAESAWFRVPPALSILGGAILGLCWYGAIGRFQ